VATVQEQMVYCVEFTDGSRCSDITAEDISHVIYISVLLSGLSSTQGTPTVGRVVSVKWTDGQLYSGTVLSLTKRPFYKVRGQMIDSVICDHPLRLIHWLG